MIYHDERWRFATAAPVVLRRDFTGSQLRMAAKQTKDAAFTRRLLALAEIYDGGSRSNAGRIGGVGLQIIRDWVLRFNAKGPDGLKDGKAPGQPSNSRTSTDAPSFRWSGIKSERSDGVIRREFASGDYARQPD